MCQMEVGLGALNSPAWETSGSLQKFPLTSLSHALSSQVATPLLSFGSFPACRHLYYCTLKSKPSSALPFFPVLHSTFHHRTGRTIPNCLLIAFLPTPGYQV